MDESPGDRPRWSFTWLLRIQRTGRKRPPREIAEGPGAVGFWKGLQLIILLLLLVEIALGIWTGVLPR